MERNVTNTYKQNVNHSSQAEGTWEFTEEFSIFCTFEIFEPSHTQKNKIKGLAHALSMQITPIPAPPHGFHLKTQSNRGFSEKLV